MCSWITRAELEELVEAPAAFTPPHAGTLIVVNERYALLGVVGGTWTSVQRIRLHDVDDDVDTVRSLMRVAGTPRASWWLSERSTPADAEEQLLARGLQRIDGDYLVDGMLLTTEPPRGDVEARAVASADEFVAAVETQYAAFNTAAAQRRDAAALRDEFELDRESGVVATYAAWIDGRIAATGRSVFTPRGVLMFGGSTAPWARGRGAYRALVRARWDDAVARGTPALAVQAGSMSAPILRKLGFEKTCQFRRLEDVASPE
jgi:hypothetical protein